MTPRSPQTGAGPRLRVGFFDAPLTGLAHSPASTYWESSDGAAYPQTITVNLGSAQALGSITLDLPPATAWSTRTETLSVLGSANGTTFSQIVASVGYTFNPTTGNTVTHQPAVRDQRPVRAAELHR